MAINVRRDNGKVFVEDPIEGPLEVKYGLPPEVTFCRNCVLSNQRAAPSESVKDTPDSPKKTVRFDDDGLCDACRVVARKVEVDWEKRQAELIALLEAKRSRNGSYDCLVPGSGGKDSIYAAHMLKTRFGMNPLTVTFAPHIYTDVGWRNFQNWIHVGGFDNYLFTVNGEVQRTLTRLAFRNLLHPFQPFTIGQRYFPVKLARKLDISLIFYGENAAEYGTAGDDDAESQVPRKYFTLDPKEEIFLGGVPAKQLNDYGITERMLDAYLPISEEAVLEAGIESHYLGYFLPWTPQENYYYSVEHAAFEANTERTEGTFSKYNSIDDRVDGFHYWTGHLKFGIGRCTHEASQEIRHGHITREEAVALVQRYDGEFPKRFFQDFLDYLDMGETEFHDIADSFRSPHLWRRTNEGWELRHRAV
jgi:N-acetyl sugar amidotransferase